MVLIGLRVLGIPIHQMSVTGLIIALGLLIDNVIVMVDEIRSRIWSGMPASAGSQRGRTAPGDAAVWLYTNDHLGVRARSRCCQGRRANSSVRSLSALSWRSTRLLVLAMTVVPAMTALLRSSIAERDGSQDTCPLRIFKSLADSASMKHRSPPSFVRLG